MRHTKYCIAVVDDALQLLKEISGMGPSTLREIYLCVGITKNKAFRILETLIAQGFIKKDEHLYSFGDAALNLCRNNAERLKKVQNKLDQELVGWEGW